MTWTDPKKFSTSDIYLAAWLRSENRRLLSYKKGKNNSIYYFFDNQDGLWDMVLEYRYGNAIANPRSMRDNVRDIKRMVQTGKKVGGEV